MKSTHTGICQICGSRQKLPGGVLAKHGYTVSGYGFFNGVCYGSGHLPYEVSCDMIETIIVNVEGEVARLEKRASNLRTADYGNATKAWVHHYVGGKRERYRWIEVELTPIVGHEGVIYRASYTQKNEAGRDRTTTVESYGNRDWTLAGIVRFANEKFAKHLDREAAGNREWIVAAKARVANWKPQPLSEIRHAA